MGFKLMFTHTCLCEINYLFSQAVESLLMAPKQAHVITSAHRNHWKQAGRVHLSCVAALPKNLVKGNRLPMGNPAGSYFLANELAQSAKMKRETCLMFAFICMQTHHLAMANDRCTANGASSNSTRIVPVKAWIITPISALWLLCFRAWCGSLIVMSLMELKALEGKAEVFFPVEQFSRKAKDSGELGLKESLVPYDFCAH